MNATYADYDAVGLAELVRTGEASPVELVETAVEQIERLNPALNAVIHRRFKTARDEALGVIPDGPFRGVPFLVKDLTAELAGSPMHSGTHLSGDYVPDFDSELVRRYRAAGLIVLGKTNTPELGLTPYTEPARYGPSRNPWALDRSPGGSSGGSAAAVASGMVPAAHGGDGGGSIRIPASCCGLFGLKPTRGRTPSGPVRTVAWQGAVVEHVLTRSVRDSAALLDATSGPDLGAANYPPAPERPFADEVGRDPGTLRIAFTTQALLGGVVDDDCVHAVHKTVQLLRAQGHVVEEAKPDLESAAFSEAFMRMVAAEAAADVAEMAARMGRAPQLDDLEPSTWLLVLVGRTLKAVDQANAVRFLYNQARTVSTFFDRYDVLLTPTLAKPPIEIGALQPTEVERRMARIVTRLKAGRLLTLLDTIGDMADRVYGYIPFTPVFNMTGQPAMSVPLHWNAAGLPIGMQFVGRFADEATLFRLAGQLEQIAPWADRRPPEP